MQLEWGGEGVSGGGGVWGVSLVLWACCNHAGGPGRHQRAVWLQVVEIKRTGGAEGGQA